MERTPRRWVDSHRCNGVQHDGVSLHRCSCAHPPLPRELRRKSTLHSFPPVPLLSFQQRSLARVVCFFSPVASRLGWVAPVVVCRLQLCRTSISHRRRRRRRTRASLLPWRRAHPRWTRKAKQKPCWTWITRKGACGSSRYVWCNHVQRTRTC